ncbi:MAG: protein translocase subunit SecD [Actinomycetes bacterium]
MSANISKATKKPAKSGRTLAVLLVLFVAFTALAIVQGDTKLKLGLDLRGGTSVTLAPKVANGGKVDKAAVEQAVAIIRQRVNSLGVAESEVSSQSNGDIIVSVPGNSSSRVVDLVGATAQLRFRQVLAVGAGSAATTASLATTSTTKTGTKSTAAPAATFPAGVTMALDTAFKNLDCTKAANRQGGALDDPNQAVVACSLTDTSKYILAPAEVEGSQVSKASAVLDNTNGNGWMVLLNFNGAGTSAFGKMTSRVTSLASPQNQAAIVLDGLVVSAPRINEAINSGSAQISGSFTQTLATDLANKLKYGALPLALSVQEINQVSPTLGADQLHAGLLAGLLGLLLVILYSVLYYRGLGLVSVGSLLVAGSITYLSFLLLGKWIGFTLTLAGIAGAIVSIGITADSFIVYFERLRDEVREGRSLRTAVETGWQRARRTILVADFVSLIAAALLYFFAVGGVRGFAFTLGLTTFVDLIVVFFFTKPFVTVLSRVAFFAEGSNLSGLSAKSLGVVTDSGKDSL